MIKVYVDRNINVQKVRTAIKNILGETEIDFIQWPLEGKTKRIQKYGKPAEIKWSDLGHVSWSDLDFCSWDDFQPTAQYDQILSIIGKEHRKDCIHFDIAIKNGCHYFLTSDKDFLQKREELQSLSQIRTYDPENSVDCKFFFDAIQKFSS